MAIYTDVSLFKPTVTPMAQDLEVIYQSIFAILNTKKGERLFRPDFGNTLEDFLFDLIDEVTALEVFRRIVEDISGQEPRVSVNLSNTKIEADPINGCFKIYLVLDLFGLSSDRLVFQGELTRQAA